MALLCCFVLASQSVWAQRAADSNRPVSGVIAASTAPVQISYTPENSTPIGRIANIGDPVYLNDEITTGPAERLQLLLADQTVFSIGPNAALLIDTFIYDPSSDAPSALVASVKKGSFKFISGKISKTSPDAMKLKLPNATASIRGTTVAGNVGLDGGTSLVLLSGAVQLTAADTGLSADLLEPGWGVDVSATGDVGAPELYSEERLDSLLTQVEFAAGSQTGNSDEEATESDTNDAENNPETQEQDDQQLAENEAEGEETQSTDDTADGAEEASNTQTDLASQNSASETSGVSEGDAAETLIEILTPELLITENILGLDEEELAASEEAATELFTALLGTESEEEAETLFKSFFEERLASLGNTNNDDKQEDTATFNVDQIASGDTVLSRSDLSSGLSSGLSDGQISDEPLLFAPSLTGDLNTRPVELRASFNDISIDRNGLIDAALIGISSSFERQLETDLRTPDFGGDDYLELASNTERQSRALEEETREAAQIDTGPSAAEIRAGIEDDLMDYLIAGGAPLWAITTYYTDTSTGQMGHPSTQTRGTNYDNLVSSAFKGSARFEKNDIELTRGQVSIPVNGRDTLYRSSHSGSGLADISFVMNYDRLSGSGTVRLREVNLITDTSRNPSGVTYADTSFPAAMRVSLSRTASLVQDEEGNLRSARTMDMENFEISELNLSDTASRTTLAGSVNMSLGSIADGENAIDGLLGQFDIQIGQEQAVEYVTNSDGDYLDVNGNIVRNAVEAATIPILSASEYVKATAE